MNSLGLISEGRHGQGNSLFGANAYDNDSLDWNEFFREAERTSLLILSDGDAPGLPASDYSRLAQVLGYRILDTIPIIDSAERLHRLVDLDAVLIVCSGSEPGIEALLTRLDMMAVSQGTRLIAITDMDGLDTVHAAIQTDNAILLCRPAIEDILIALASIRRQGQGRDRLSDIGRDGDNSQIERLSDQLVRLSRTIEALLQNRSSDEQRPWPMESAGGGALRSPSRDYASAEGSVTAGDIMIGSHHVRALLRARRLREQVVAADLFADPAWDILLDLMAARLEQTRVSVSSLCIAAAVPPTTALRWIRQLTERGLLKRQADPHDGRRIFIALSDEGATVVQRWFSESRSHLLTALGINQ